jgi:ribosomal protein L15
LEDIREVFSHFKELEAQIDILSPKEEEKIDEIIETLAQIDVDKLKSAKEVIEIVDTVQVLLSTFKSKILMGQSEEVLDMVQNIRSLLEIIVKRL